MADFSGLRLPNTGSFQLTAYLTYSGTETNFTIPEVTSQSFQAVEAPPGNHIIRFFLILSKRIRPNRVDRERNCLRAGAIPRDLSADLRYK